MKSKDVIKKFVSRASAQDMAYYAASRLSDHISKTPEGFLLCIAVPIARTGDLTYAKGELLDSDGNEAVEDLNGLIKVTRGEEDLFHPSTMASFEGKGITVDHPEEFICPVTFRDVAVGHMQNIRRGEGVDADKLFADFLITDPDAIALVESPNGLREVSLGYDADYEQTKPGFARQTNIVGNHAALVRKGRNGSEIAVRDSAPATTRRSHPMTISKKKVKSVSVGDALKKLLGRAFDEAMPEGEEVVAEATDDMETRLKNIEDAIAKLIGGGEEEETMDEGDEGTTDEGDEGTTDEDAAAKAMDERLTGIEDALVKLAGAKTGDKAAKLKAKANDAKTADAATISRAEILVPGLKPSADLVKETLAQFAKTTDGAAILSSFESLDDNSKFIAASELVKAKRLAAASRPTIDNMPTLNQGPMTPEKINELNAAHYSGKK